MRLIDADALLNRTEVEPLTFDGGIDINDLERIIKQQPTIEPKQADDLISRADAIDALENAKERYFDRAVVIARMQDVLRDIPSAQPRHGEWKRKLVDNGFNADWECSECKYRVKTDFVSYNFCPNCGARMTERSE